MVNINKINQFLQTKLKKHYLLETTAIEANRWLEKEGLLKDSKSRKGKPLRDLLRQNKILGQIQIPNKKNGRRYIRRINLNFWQKIFLVLRDLFR
jgi:hypothetical protein